MKFKVVITKGEDGYCVVRCPALQGCISQGRTVKEALENIKEAIELCLEVERDETQQLQKGEQIVEVEV